MSFKITLLKKDVKEDKFIKPSLSITYYFIDEEETFLMGFTTFQKYKTWNHLFARNYFESQNDFQSSLSPQSAISEKSSLQQRNGSHIIIASILESKKKYSRVFPNKKTVDDFMEFAKKSQENHLHSHLTQR